MEFFPPKGALNIFQLVHLHESFTLISMKHCWVSLLHITLDLTRSLSLSPPCSPFPLSSPYLSFIPFILNVYSGNDSVKASWESLRNKCRVSPTAIYSLLGESMGLRTGEMTRDVYKVSRKAVSVEDNNSWEHGPRWWQKKHSRTSLMSGSLRMFLPLSSTNLWKRLSPFM